MVPSTDNEAGPRMSDDSDAPTAVWGRDVHHTYHDPEGEATLSTAVIEAVAAVAGVDPSRTRVPLARSINPDALDQLFDRRGDDPDDDAQVVFSVWDLTVIVHADGNIFVHEDSRSGSFEG